MRTYRLEKTGNLDGLVMHDEPKPVPGRHEVLVRVRATSLNFRDRMLVLGKYPYPMKPNVVPICDAAGEIEAIGEGVTRFAAGDRVISTFFPKWLGGPLQPKAVMYGTELDGWLTDYRVVPEEELARAPATTTFEEAATLPCAGVTAWSALAGVGPGDSVLTQGSGGVSVFALQLAKILGARVIATTSSAENGQRLLDLGASAVVSYVDNPAWSGKVRELTSGRGVDRIVEVGGPGTLAESMKALAYGGEIAVVGALAAEPAAFDFWSLFLNQTTLRPIGVGSRAGTEALVRVVENHALHPVIDRVFALDDAKAAFAHYFEARPFGKVVIRH